MISIPSLIQNNISNSCSSSGSMNSSNQCISNQSSNQECYSIKGLNCIFSVPLPTFGGRACSPYIVLKINGANIISSVCKVLSNSAFWNDCLSFRVDSEQPEKLITVEIHNYTLYQTEKDLLDPNFDEKDYLGNGTIDLSDVLAQRQPLKGYSNNSNSSFTMIQSSQASNNIYNGFDGRSASTISNNSGLSNSTQNNNNNIANSVYIGQAKIMNKDGLIIGSLQFNIHREQQYSSSNSNNNNTNSSNTIVSSCVTSTTTSQQTQLEDNYKSLTSKLSEMLPLNNRNMQLQQQSLSIATYQPKSTCYNSYSKRDASAEEREYRSIKNTPLTPASSKNNINNNFFINNSNYAKNNNYNLNTNPFILNTMKSNNSESDPQSTSINHGQFNNPSMENSQTPRYHSYNMIKLGEDDQFNQLNVKNNNSSICQEDFEQYEDQASQYSSENSYNQQMNPFSKPNQKQSSNEYANTTVSPLRDLNGKSYVAALSASQTAKPYIGFQSQFGQPIQYPQFYAAQTQQQQTQPSIQQQQQVGLINLQNVPYQQYNNTTTTPSTISTCSQRNNQINQIPYSNFSQAVQVLGQNSMNITPSQGQQFQLQNNLIRTVQSQKTILNKFPQNSCNTQINPVVSPAVYQYQNNSNQGISTINANATPASLQKLNVGVSTSRQPFSAAATPFKNQRNGQNFYQPF